MSTADERQRPRQGAAAVIGLVLVLAASAALAYFAFVETGREGDASRPPVGVPATPEAPSPLPSASAPA